MNPKDPFSLTNSAEGATTEPPLTHLDVEDLEFTSPTDLTFTVTIDHVLYHGELSFEAHPDIEDCFLSIADLTLHLSGAKASGAALTALADHLERAPDWDRISYYYYEAAAAEGDRLYDAWKEGGME